MNYYIYKNQKICGPFTSAQLRNSDEFTPDDLVRPESCEDWVKLSKIDLSADENTIEQSAVQNSINEETEEILTTEYYEKYISSLVANFEKYLELLNNLNSLKNHKILQSEIKLISSAFEKHYSSLQENVSQFIEIRINEQKRIIEAEYYDLLDKEKTRISEEIRQSLLKQFELDYEIKLNKIRKDAEQNFYDQFAKYCKEAEEKYKSDYFKNSEELRAVIEPEIEKKYLDMFEAGKQDFINSAYSRLDEEYSKKFKTNLNTALLELEIDYALKFKRKVEQYDADFREKLKTEIYRETKETIMNSVLNEVKIEREKFKENCSYQLEADRKLLQKELENELFSMKRQLKDKADEYIHDQLSKYRGNLQENKL